MEYDARFTAFTSRFVCMENSYMAPEVAMEMPYNGAVDVYGE